MYINSGAAPPQPKIIVRRGTSTSLKPIMSVAQRVWDRRHAPVSSDMSTLKLIPFKEIHRKLLELNPRMFFIPIGDGRVGIGVETPSAGHIAAYERLTYYERKEIDAVREIPGPRRLLICASENAVDPYTELLSRNPSRVIARALRTIIRACVEGGAFTWEAAEAKFGMPFKNATTNARILDMAPTVFHKRNDSTISL